MKMLRCGRAIPVKRNDFSSQRVYLPKFQWNKPVPPNNEPVAPNGVVIFIDSRRTPAPETDARTYSLPINQVFASASKEYSGIAMDPATMAGAPCIAGTRIPVYMVLDAVEHYGSLDVTLSYPRLTLQQVKDAIGFAKLVVECPIDDRPASLA